MEKNNRLMLFLILIIIGNLAASSSKIEKVLDVAEKVNDVGSSIPGFDRISQVIGQGLDITRDLVTIFKEVPNPDQDLTVREKYYKDKKVLERYREDYGTIEKISTANMKDFKFLYDEVKNILKQYGKPNDVLQKEWKPYHDNEASYIMEAVNQVLQKIKEGINRLENSDVLSNFEVSVAAVSNRLYAKQNTVLRVVNALKESEESVSKINKSQKYLFNSILQKNKLSIKEYVLYNTYNAILDSYSFIQTKNKLYITLKDKLNPIVENLVELREKNKFLSARYAKKLAELSDVKSAITKYNFLEESKRFDKKRRIVNPEIAIPIYGWFRVAADPGFRYKEVTDNKPKGILFQMNKYIVTGK